MKNLFILGLIVALSGCTPIVKKNLNHQTVLVTQEGNNDYAIIDKKHKELLSKGEELVGKGDKKDAIIHYFNPIIKDYEKIYANSSKRVYTARTKEEHDFYSMTAINEGKLAHVLSDNWSRAYFLKAYALLELNELGLAEKNIRKALYLAPSNSKYISELGHIQHLNKDWKKALQSYKLAEKSANLFSPENLKKQEVLRAKRGIGFSYTELKEFNKAEAVYADILKIDALDKIALRELKYIHGLKR